MKEAWTLEERKQFLKNIEVIKRLHMKQKSVEDIADMVEIDINDVELIVNLINDGFYNSNQEIFDAFLILES